jgi:hypothetical protein
MAFATTVTETDVTVASATVPVRLDSSVLSNRYWVRVINPHATLRIYVGHSPSNTLTNVTQCETVDPFNGVWEDSIGPNVPIYAVSESGTSIIVRVKQYA